MKEKKRMFYKNFFIFLTFLLFVSCNENPYLPHAWTPVTEEGKEVLFEFDGEPSKEICLEGTWQDQCQITGYIKNIGDGAACNCYGRIKIYSDMNRTSEIPSSNETWEEISRTFFPGNREPFSTYALDDSPCENIRAIEVVLTYYNEGNSQGEQETQTLFFVFN